MYVPIVPRQLFKWFKNIFKNGLYVTHINKITESNQGTWQWCIGTREQVTIQWLKIIYKFITNNKI